MLALAVFFWVFNIFTDLDVVSLALAEGNLDFAAS
jgi:hypothetical protein